jgi:transcriptional regulator with GAF, ATPase, and Fis domain
MAREHPRTSKSGSTGRNPIGPWVVSESSSDSHPEGATAREWPGKITNAVESTNANCYELQPISGEKTNLQSDKTSVADEYERRQRDEIARVLTACRGRGGGADGAAARLGVNRTTLLWRMKKYGIYAKQYA